MDGSSSTLLSLHAMAEKHGVALNPKLRRLLEQQQQALPPDVPQVAAPVASVGPAHQTYRPEDLDSEKIVQLEVYRPSRVDKGVARKGT